MMARRAKTDGLLPISTGAIEALRGAAARKSTWLRAQRDPAAFLSKLDLALPDDVDLQLYDLVIPEGGLVAHGEDVARPLGGGAGLPSPRPVPPGLERWWEATHMGCPFGTYPSKTTRDETVCLRWGVVLSGKEWIPDSPGSASGHFGYTQSYSVCLLSLTRSVEVIVCLPLYATLEAQP
jgi:hypothetical protein